MNRSCPPTLGRQLAMAAKATRAEFDARLAEVGGSLTAFIVLRLADEAPGGLELSQRQLAERMGVEAPTMVRHLDRLEKECLIERRRDARDRRVTRIAVTPAGSRRLGVLRKVADAMDAEILTLLGPKTYRGLASALDRLQEHMTQLSGERKSHAHAVL
ncbi:MAG TPA: MarR family winged helix-turn-helix transcriptional regulator [Actinomycetota bacterium]|nr:MarR family winged helix-turn-helix transcriptional regulator [Actinomycetota bacterium]